MNEQESGDLIVLPKEIGHATINVEASIGFAFEMTYHGYDPIRFTVESASRISSMCSPVVEVFHTCSILQFVLARSRRISRGTWKRKSKLVC